MNDQVEWCTEMLTTLRAMRARGEPLYLCAEKLGIGYATTVYKARELGLAQRMNAGRRPGTEVLKIMKPG